MNRVLNLRTLPGHRIPPNAVYVGRAVPRQGIKASPWGNPFTLRHGASDEERDECIARFKVYAVTRLQSEPHWLDPLIGKDLVCWCAPAACHANVLLELIAGLPKEVAV